MSSGLRQWSEIGSQKKDGMCGSTENWRMHVESRSAEGKKLRETWLAEKDGVFFINV